MLKICLAVCAIKMKSWLCLISTEEEKQKWEPAFERELAVFVYVLNSMQTLT